MNEPDSALLFGRIAHAINPYNPIVTSNLGLAYFHAADYGKAEACWIEALNKDSTLIMPRLDLLRQYEQLGQKDKYDSFLLETSKRADSPMQVLRQLGDYYLSHGEFEQASLAYQQALAKGLDSAYVRDIQSANPALTLPSK